MKNLYYIVKVEARPDLDPTNDVPEGVVVPYDEVLDFYEVALMEYDDNGSPIRNNEERKVEAKHLRDAGKECISDDTGCGVSPEYLSDKEYFQRRLEGLQTLEEFRNSCE